MADTSVTLVGNLTDDPELRFTPGGAAVANFSVAVTARVRDGDGWKDGDTSFYRCNVWRDQAENAADTLAKGMRVLVLGTLRESRWESDDGTKRSRVEITVDEVGPALKWATATVERVRRDGNSKSDAKPKSRSRGSSRQRDAVPAKGGSFDEEPPF